MPTLISKVPGTGTSLGTATAATQIGGASQYTPEWATRLKGIKVAGICITPTTQEAAHGTIKVSSNSFSPNPSTVPFVINTGSVATNSVPIAPNTEYWPMNFKIHGGEPYDIYAQAAVANTAAPYLTCEVFFGTEDAVMPSKYDKYPHGVETYYDVSSLTGTATASASQALPVLTITGAKAVTEVFGYMLKTATAAAKGILGYYRFASNGFDTSPVDLMIEPVNSTLGTVTAEDPASMARSPYILGCSPTTIIQATYNQGGGVAITTDIGNVGVAFVRDWGR